MKALRAVAALAPILLFLTAPIPAAAAAGPGPDFNGDGYPDYVIGSDYQVIVRYGGGKPTEGISYTGVGQWQGAIGDFNDDGYDDLALGGSEDSAWSGEVRVYYGHSYGLVKGDLVPYPQVLTESVVGGRTQSGARFGRAVAAGDLTGDGVADLAIGAPRHDRTGIVTVVPGVPDGLLGFTPSRILSQASPGVIGTPEKGDDFGAALTVADITGDGIGDLVVGAPGENGVGMVHVLPGGKGGPSGSGSSAVAGTSVVGLVPSQTNSSGSTEGLLGFSVAVADVSGDGYADVIAGAPSARVHHWAGWSGGIAVLRGDGSGIDRSRAQFTTQASAGVVGAAEGGDRFGELVKAGDLDGNGRAEVVVGVPDEFIGREDGWPQGTFVVLRGSPAGVTGKGSYAVSQNTPNVPGTAENGDCFATAFDVEDVNGDGRTDVIVGSYGEETSTPESGHGAVAVLISDAQGRPGPSSTVLTAHPYGWAQSFGVAITAS